MRIEGIPSSGHEAVLQASSPVVSLIF